MKGVSMRHNNKMEEKRRLHKLMRECGYFAGAYYDKQKNRICRFSYSCKAIKKAVSRKLRRSRVELANGCYYKKVYEYRYECI